MTTLSELYKSLENIIPSELSCSWDNDGLMVSGDTEKTVKKALIALDATNSVIEYAIEINADVIITHHPLIFSPIRSLVSPKLITLVKKGISVLSFHTRLDALDEGVNSALAAKLCIENTEALSSELGLIGDAHTEISVNDYAEFVCKALGCDAVSFIPSEKTVRRVAVVGGSGKDYIDDAVRHGADVFVTGESGYHSMCDAADMGLHVIDAGHYETEQPVCEVLNDFIRRIDPDIKTFVYESKRIRHKALPLR